MGRSVLVRLALTGVATLSAVASRMAEAAEPPPNDAHETSVVPDLETVRYHDPRRARELWLGLDAGGVAIPARATGLGRRAWSARVGPTWSFAVAPRLAVGGRHAMTWYDVRNVRLRVHEHELQISGSLMRYRPRLRDRPAVGVEVRDVKLAVVQGVDFKLGGIRDLVLWLGYGLEHDLTSRLELGWRVDLRQVWVLLDTQRQLRAAARLAFLPRPRHRLALQIVGFYVNRDEDQAGTEIRRNTAHGQVLGTYTWMSRRRVGVVVGARYTTGFRSGEAPVYELRAESIRAHYGEGSVGLRVVW